MVNIDAVLSLPTDEAIVVELETTDAMLRRILMQVLLI